MIRRGRETLGFSQARLGELVGRSASTIRNWERGKSTPSVAADAVALAAVLGLDERRVVEAAGFEPSEVAKHQTVEQAYASLAPPAGVETGGAVDRDADDPPPAEAPVAPDEEPPPRSERDPAEPVPARSGYSWPTGPVPEPRPEPTPPPDPEPAPDAGSDGEPDPAPDQPPSPSAGPWLEDEPSVPPRRASVPSSPPSAPSRPSTAPPGRRLMPVPPEPAAPSAEQEAAVGRAAPPTVLEAAPTAEPSYVENPEERQRYRVRAVATAAVVLFLFLVLLWSFDRATDALGAMWDQFVGMLEL